MPLTATVAGMKAGKDGENEMDRVQSICYFDYKRPPPTIKDDDPNLDKYDREFDIAIQCWEFNGRWMKDINKLYIYGNGFDQGSTRRRVFENMLRRASTEGRIPANAKEVLEEIKTETHRHSNSLEDRQTNKHTHGEKERE